MSNQEDNLMVFHFPDHLQYMSQEGLKTITFINTKDNTLIKFDDLYARAIIFLMKTSSLDELHNHLTSIYDDLDSNFLRKEIQHLIHFLNSR